MTEIIIDGVDVSGCIYKKDDIFDCGNPACGGYKCEGQICLYKQVKRLEQENAKLKEELAEANQLKDMYHTYYRAKHDDIKGIIFKQKEKLEKIKHIMNVLNNVGYYKDLEKTVLQIIEGAEE